MSFHVRIEWDSKQSLSHKLGHLHFGLPPPPPSIAGLRFPS